MNLFAELLSTTQTSRATATGPRIQKRRGVEIKSAREVKIMRQASNIVATVLRPQPVEQRVVLRLGVAHEQQQHPQRSGAQR